MRKCADFLKPEHGLTCTSPNIAVELPSTLLLKVSRNTVDIQLVIYFDTAVYWTRSYASYYGHSLGCSFRRTR